MSETAPPYTTIPPALTAEEWKKALRYPPGVVFGFEDDEGEMSRHRMAAMCLHGQSFGFTDADVVNLRSYALRHHNEIGWTSHWTEHWAAKLADRIEALIPPQT